MNPQTFLKVTLHVDNDAWCVLDHHDEDFDGKVLDKHEQWLSHISMPAL
jgi:hypothetical protein